MTLRLFQRNGWFHVEFSRGKSKSLKTKSRAEAVKLLKLLEKEMLLGRLIAIDREDRLSLGDFTLKYLKSRFDVSTWTKKKDALSLKLFSDVIGAGVMLRLIERDHLERFKEVCLARGALPVTINGYLRHLKAAFNWAYCEGLIKKKPILKMLRVQDLPPRVISSDDLRRLLRAAFRFDQDFGRRVFVHLYTGARRRELCGLQWQDIDFDSGWITLKGKGGRVRRVPMLEPVRRHLYRRRRDLGPVFDQMHPDNVSHLFKKITTGVGVSARLHDLRHTCATNFLSAGVPLPVVQALLGHAAISTTQIYAKTMDGFIKNSIAGIRFLK